ncbi:hypothetical protein CH268_16110 [Rhodococcus sp. 06-1460-1B]|nr:hypothetical protein CH266_19300 [Rhodococcus sp. 06-1474-1B]OZD59708.1 hypothetical protein CH268_16110 [Rhodococcus sp. 06-1460-1B]
MQLIGIHVSHGALDGELLRADRFDIVAYCIGLVLRTDFGWRIDMLTFTIVWDQVWQRRESRPVTEPSEREFARSKTSSPPVSGSWAK